MKNNAAMEDHWSNNPRFKAEQEPLAWVEVNEGRVAYDVYRRATENLPDGVRFDLFKSQQPAPPQRTWVGLTDEEVKHMLELFVVPPHHVEMVVQAIEAKLKEKNT